MAEKKTKPITTLGSEDKLTVQKSHPLFHLWRSELTLAEFKILDVYLSRINSHEPDKRTIILEKGELEKILGVKKINNADLEKRLIHLMQNVVKVPDASNEKGFTLVTLFEEIEAKQDEYGLWQVTLECTQKAMKYFFNIENLGYFQYKLRCVTSFTSRYTYIMFLYLEKNRFRKTWEVNVGEIKKILNCDKVKAYSTFKDFNKDVLQRIHKEIHEKTACKYIYEPVKKGRSVVAVRFTVETLQENVFHEVSESEMLIKEYKHVKSKNKIREELWATPLQQFNFTEEEYDEIFAVLTTIPDSRLPESSACPGEIELMRYHYIEQKAKEIIRRNSEKNIKNKFAYLLKVMKNDAK